MTLIEPLLQLTSTLCAKWILKTTETRKLTRSASIGIIQDVSEIVSEVSTMLYDQVKSSLVKNGIELGAIPELCDIFSEHNFVVTPFKNITTFHQQLELYKKHYNFIVRQSINYYLSFSMPNTGTKANCTS